MGEKKKSKEERELEYIEEEADVSSNLETKVKKLKENLKRCQKEKNEYLEGWQRERASFLNYKKEEDLKIQEKVDEIKKHIFSEILPIIDNFNRAMNAVSESDFSQNKWLGGIKQIKREFERFLENFGVKEIMADGGDMFNPEFHEAVEVVDGEDGKVIEIIQKGYMLNKKILRPVRVKVGKKLHKI